MQWKTVLGICLLGLVWAGLTTAAEIVHDAEFYVLRAQHGDDWAAEDKKLDAKLAALAGGPTAETGSGLKKAA